MDDRNNLNYPQEQKHYQPEMTLQDSINQSAENQQHQPPGPATVPSANTTNTKTSSNGKNLLNIAFVFSIIACFILPTAIFILALPIIIMSIFVVINLFKKDKNAQPNEEKSGIVQLFKALAIIGIVIVTLIIGFITFIIIMIANTPADQQS